MPRKGHIAKRDVLVDPIYNSKLVTRLVNKIMIDGKKGVAQNILYNAFQIVEEKTNEVYRMFPFFVNELKISDVDKAKDLLEGLIIGGKKSGIIPNGFRSIIPPDTSILDINLENKILNSYTKKGIFERGAYYD